MPHKPHSSPKRRFSSRLVLTFVLIACSASGACAPYHSRSGVLETGQDSETVLRCNVLMPLLASLPIPDTTKIGSSVLATAGSANRMVARTCAPTPKATLGQETIDDIAAIVGFEVEQKLDDQAVLDLGGLLRHMSNYTHGSATAASELSDMRMEANALVVRFQSSNQPLVFLVNFMGAATMEMTVLEEILLNDIEAGVKARDLGHDTSDLSEAVKKDAENIRNAAADYESHGDRLRTQLLPVAAKGFFDDLKVDSHYETGWLSKTYKYKQTRPVRDFSSAEKSYVNSLIASGQALPLLLKIRQELLANPLSLEVSIGASLIGFSHDDNDPVLAQAKVDFAATWQAKVTEIQTALDKALFQTAEMSLFVSKIHDARANAEATYQAALGGRIFTKDGGT